VDRVLELIDPRVEAGLFLSIPATSIAVWYCRTMVFGSVNANRRHCEDTTVVLMFESEAE
jgi:hypothetical protein